MKAELYREAAITCDRCDDFGRLPDGPCPDCEIRAMAAEDPTIVVICYVEEEQADG